MIRVRWAHAARLSKGRHRGHNGTCPLSSRALGRFPERLKSVVATPREQFLLAEALATREASLQKGPPFDKPLKWRIPLRSATSRPCGGMRPLYTNR